jgi:ABC-2 type transport system ATP-binding protein
MSDAPPLRVEGLTHRYGTRQALRAVCFTVAPGEIFGLLGPNGGGKTTLFRILSTSLVPSGGRALVFGLDVVRDAAAVRRQIGVVFQAPSLDKKLTAAENLWHHGHLYGLSGRALRDQSTAMLARVGLADRARERVERLSGGQQRRVEIAQGLLHRPRLLILDEPSTGLDPGARRDLWDYLLAVRQESGITVVLTTHLMDEAERCDRLAILHQGSLVALDAPRALTQELGGEVVYLDTDQPEQLAERVRSRLGCAAEALEGSVRVEHERAHELVADLFRAFPDAIRSVTLRRPSLEDVFIRRTGHRFWNDPEKPAQDR